MKVLADRSLFFKQALTVALKELPAMLAEANGGNLRKRIEMAGKSGFFETMSRA